MTVAAFWQIFLLALDKRTCGVDYFLMNASAADPIRERVRQWAEAATIMQEVRDEDIRSADTARAMRCFRGAVEALVHTHPPEPWSGLVTQQRWFAKLRTV